MDDVTAWILLFFGLYAAAAAVGEIRRRGTWARLMWEVERSASLQIIFGLLRLLLGTAIMLANPYDGLDLPSILVTIMGGLVMFEGLMFLAFPDWLVRLSRHFTGSRSSIWGWCVFFMGISLLTIGYIRMFPS